MSKTCFKATGCSLWTFHNHSDLLHITELLNIKLRAESILSFFPRLENVMPTIQSGRQNYDYIHSENFSIRS